jgi:general secretion pathway protein G
LIRKITLTSLFGFALVVVLLLPFVSFGVSKEEMKIRRAGMDCASIVSALKACAEKGARPPTTGQGLEALVERPTVEPLPEDWARIAIQVPLDPWRQAYRYRELAREGILFRWEVRSIGPDGIAGNEDDIAREFEWEGR